MTTIIVSIIGLLAIVAAFVFRMSGRISRKAFIAIGAVGLVTIVAGNSFVVIPTGYSGVRSTFGQIDEVALQNGFNWKIPFVQSIEKVNNKQQDVSFSGQIWSESSARTALYAEGIVVTYTIKPDKSAWVYANVSNYKDGLVGADIVSSAFKTASKNFEDVDVTNRAKIEPATEEALQDALDTKYEEDVVFINKVTINNLDFEETYNQAIAEKQNAQLAYERQQIENQTAIEKAEAEAQAKIIAAEGEAEANAKKQQTLTDEIIRNQWIEKWDGMLPDSLLGSDINDVMVGTN